MLVVLVQTLAELVNATAVGSESQQPSHTAFTILKSIGSSCVNPPKVALVVNPE
jgi:hypothetical protein